MVDPLPRTEAFQNSRFFIESILGDQAMHRLSDHFLCRVSEKALRPLIPTHDAAIEVFGNDGVIGRLHDRSQTGQEEINLKWKLRRSGVVSVCGMHLSVPHLARTDTDSGADLILGCRARVNN